MIHHYKILNILKDETADINSKAGEIFLLTMKPVTKLIFNAILTNPQGVTCKDIKSITGLDTKNISTMLNELILHYPLIEINKDNPKKFKYFIK